MANECDNTVSVLFGSRRLGFSSPITLPVGLFPVAVAVGDFNGDHFPDLAVANNGDDTVVVWFGQRGNQFGSSASFAVGFAPDSIAVTDVNRDGKLDLVVANSPENDPDTNGTSRAASARGAGGS